MNSTTAYELPLGDLGTAAIDESRLNAVVSTALGRPAQVSTLDVRPVDYPDGSIATDLLLRCAGSAVVDDGRSVPWRVFVKGLRSARVWPYLHLIPESARQQWIDDFPWRIEIEAYGSDLGSLLDPGMRLPQIFAVIETDDDHAAIWMEDVATATVAWDEETFARSARHLGVLAGRRPLGTEVVFGPAHMVATPGYALRMFAFGRLLLGAAPLLRDVQVWQHPQLEAALSAVGESDLQADLVAALEQIEPWLSAMDELPQTYVHGDASPQNLLVPVDDPGTFVMIDPGFNSPQCVGFDLGQLLVGLVHAGEMSTAELPRLRQVVVPAFVDGLRSTGFAATAAQVEQGFLLATVVRSMFTAIPLERLGGPAGLPEQQLLIERIRLTRYLLSCADEISTAGRTAV